MRSAIREFHDRIMAGQTGNLRLALGVTELAEKINREIAFRPAV